MSSDSSPTCAQLMFNISVSLHTHILPKTCVSDTWINLYAILGPNISMRSLTPAISNNFAYFVIPFPARLNLATTAATAAAQQHDAPKPLQYVIGAHFLLPRCFVTS